MKPVRVPCTQCLGTGRVDLVPSLRLTLHLLRRRPVTAAELHAASVKVEKRPPSVQAFHNRLEKLRRYGFATRQKLQGAWRYSLTRNVSRLTAGLGRRNLV